MSTRYTISWLYGELRVARIHRDKIVEQWEAPNLVESQADLVRALDTAGEFLDLSARGDVTVVHEHDLHTHDYLEVPAMKRRDLEKYLQRRVEQDKSFDEPAAWCYHKVRHRGGKEGVLLHLLPDRIVKATVSACTAVGLAPKKYVPLTEIVSDYLPTMDLPDDRLLVVVACFKERTEIILALGDGEALFVRELHYGQGEIDRLITDINRTIRYTRQQLGRSVDETHIMGVFDAPIASRLQEQIETEVTFDEAAAEPFFWARQGAKLSGKLSANFISVFAQKNMTGEVFRRVGVWTTAATVAVSVVMTLFTGGLVAHRADQMSDIASRSQLVEEKIAELESRLQEGRMKQDHLERLRASSHNLPSLFMLHLSYLTPDDVTLTKVSVAQSSAGWEVALRGVVAGDMRRGARTLAEFEQLLASDPWFLTMTQPFTQTWMEQFEQGRLSSESTQLGFEIVGAVL